MSLAIASLLSNTVPTMLIKRSDACSFTSYYAEKRKTKRVLLKQRRILIPL